MSTIEKKMIEWVEKNIVMIGIAIFLLISIGIRYILRGIISGDARVFLIPWYAEIKETGISHQVGNYNIMYQTIIMFLTKLPIKDVYAYKLISCLFDYALAVSISVFYRIITGEEEFWRCAIPGIVVLFLPSVFLNSSAWAQCDSIYTFFIILSLIYLFRDKYTVAFVLLGIALVFKLQTAFILPFYCFHYFKTKAYSILKFVWLPVCLMVSGLPVVIYGRSIMEVFSIYSTQTEEYAEKLFLNYPSFWMLVRSEEELEEYGVLIKVAILITAMVLFSTILLWIVKKVELTKKNMLYMAFLLTYSAVIMLPTMHERYGFLYEILSVPIALQCKKCRGITILLQLIAVRIYGRYLFNSYVEMGWLSWINILVFAGFYYILNSEMINEYGK